MKKMNLDHALSIYKDIKENDVGLTNDLGQLYFAIMLLGEEVIRLQNEISKEKTEIIVRKK
jgi:hypothetical protein